MIANAQITIRDVTDITIGATEPANPVMDLVWVDTSVDPAAIRRWNGADWVTTGVDAGVIKLIQDKLTEQSGLLDGKADKADLANKADTTAVQTLFESLITQTNVNINYEFTKATTATATVDGKIEAFETLVKSYIVFGDVGRGEAPGIKMGVSNSPFMTVWGIDKLSFLQDGEEVAYISNNKLYITQAWITTRLTLGKVTNPGWFVWKVTPGGGLGLQWQNKT